MGANLAKFSDETDEEVLSFTNPNKPDWIVKHAEVTNLALVEVERLWKRFQQLGCDSSGALGPDVLTRSPASNDVFAKNVLGSLLGSKKRITFYTFLNVMKWAEERPAEDKLKAVFGLLNYGDPVSKDQMFKVLKRTYPYDTEESVRHTTEAFMKELDTRNEGRVTEAQFVEGALKLPADRLRSLLSFHIVPNNITREAQKIFEINKDAYKI